MKRLAEYYRAAAAAVVLAGCISTLGIALTLAGVILVVVMHGALRRAEIRAEARHAARFANGREHFMANMVVALPYVIAPSAASDDLYREAVSTLHDLAGDEPTPGALLGAALLLAVRARSQVRCRRKAASQPARPAESTKTDDAVAREVADLRERTISLEPIDVGDGRYRLVTGEVVEVEASQHFVADVRRSLANPDEPEGC